MLKINDMEGGNAVFDAPPHTHTYIKLQYTFKFVNEN